MCSPVRRTNTGRVHTGGLSHSRLRELLLYKIAKLGFDPGMHRSRAGDATMAANAGVQDRLFQQHGLWKSESAKDGYGTDSAQIQVKLTCLKKPGHVAQPFLVVVCLFVAWGLLAPIDPSL